MGPADAQGAREDVRVHRLAQVAEPDTLVVRMEIADRDALIADDPHTYYLKEHYVGYPCVLVRLSRVRPDALRDLITGAHRYISGSTRKMPARRSASAKGGRHP